MPTGPPGITLNTDQEAFPPQVRCRRGLPFGLLGGGAADSHMVRFGSAALVDSYDPVMPAP